MWDDIMAWSPSLVIITLVTIFTLVLSCQVLREGGGHTPVTSDLYHGIYLWFDIKPLKSFLMFLFEMNEFMIVFLKDDI